MMMRRHLLGIVGLIILGMVSTAVVSAQNVSPPPVSPPPGGVGRPPEGQPALFILERTHPTPTGNGAQAAYATYPYDFQFADRVVGYSFKPGERVTVTVENKSASPVTVTADESGSFQAELDFVWRFCGASASRAPAPVFHATGNQGSSAVLTEFAPPCPELVPLVPQVIPIEKPVVGTVQPVSTAVAGTAHGGAAPPSGGPPPAGSEPEPVYQPQPTTVPLQGFGFVAGEHVMITVGTLNGQGQATTTSPPVVTIADSQGRLQVSVQVTLPLPCSGRPYPAVTAMGDKGTSFTAPLFWFRPMAYLCPVRGAPVAPGAGDTGSAPAPVAPTTGACAAGTLSLKLRHATVRRGKVETVTIQAGDTGSISLSVSYFGQAGIKRSLQGSAGKSLSAQWRVPRTAHPGRASVTVVSAATGATLQATFTVK